MRILHLLSQKQPTGAERYALTLGQWQLENDNSVFLISDQIHFDTKIPYTLMPVHDAKGFSRVRSIFQLKSFLHANQIQLIHCHSRAAARLAYWAVRGFLLNNGDRVTVVSTIHGRQPISFSKKIKNIYGQKQIAVCENIRIKLVEQLWMRPTQISSIGNPVLIDEIKTQSNPHLKNKIAWVGRFSSYKGERLAQLLDKSFEVILEANKDLTLELIGGPISDLPEYGQNAYTKLKDKFRDRIQHLSHVDNIDSKLNEYRMVIGAGRVAINCLLSQTPVFAVGEYCTTDLIRLKNYEDIKNSNFGDIGFDGLASINSNPSEVTIKLLKALEEIKVNNSNDLLELRNSAISDFDVSLIAPKIMNLYYSARGTLHLPNNIPVLMYHKIPNEELASKHKIYVTKENFKMQMEWFSKNNFTSITFSDLHSFRSGVTPFIDFPKKPFIISFDDGYKDNLTNAAPILKEMGMKAVIYLLADESVTNNYWDLDGAEPVSEIMSLEEKKDLLNNYSFELGSHGFRHQKMTELSHDQVVRELQDSKIILEKVFNQKILSYAYTYGIRSNNASKLAENAGYSFAVNTDSGGLRFEEDPFSIFRVNIFPQDGPLQLSKKTAWWYRKYFYIKKGK